jgi:hypothetical protein
MGRSPQVASAKGYEAARGSEAASVFSSMKANMYVDGFNLCYGAVRGTNYRRLNIAQMC